MTATSPHPAAVPVPRMQLDASASVAAFRRRVAGACLILAPLAFAAAELLGPEGNGTPRQVLDAWAAHRTAGLLSCFAGLLATLLFLPGIFGLVTPLVDRGRRAAHIAVTAMLYGLVMAHAALVGVNLVFHAMTDPSLDRNQMVRLVNLLMHEVPVGAPLLLGHYVFAIGVVSLAIALIRSGAQPRWTAFALIVGLICDMVLGSLPLPADIGAIVSEAFLVVGFGAIGIRMLTGANHAY